MTESTVTLPLLPLTSGVVLPGMAFTLVLENAEARAAAEAAGPPGGRLLIVPLVEGRYATVGTIAEITEVGTLPGGNPAVVVTGLARAVIGTGVPGTGDALWVEAEPVPESGGNQTEDSDTAAGVDSGADGEEVVGDLAREYRAVLENILVGRGARRVIAQIREISDPGQLADLAGSSPDLSLVQKVEILETIDVEARLRLVLGWARDTLADLALRERIKTDVEEGMERSQREFLLRRQLGAIRKELRTLAHDGGEGSRGPDGTRSSDGADGGEDPDDVLGRIRERDLPEKVREALVRESERMDRVGEQSPEYGWIRTWIDTVLDLPWSIQSEDHTDVAEAARILDADHDGLDDVKHRVIEHLSVRRLRSERQMGALDGRGSGAILSLIGPPGVGKTSLGESVARALGRSFVRVSLGGIRDEAEIRGHRRTYVGARPGRIVRALTEAGTMNPVIMLDEVDKIGSDFRGDPSSALLEVLDPAQNHTFRDNYLELDLDLSEVLFIATANVLETIPSPLLDRMEVIRIEGYTETEKVSIARHHLLARQVARAGLKVAELDVTEEAIRKIVSDYTREAGVRNLERELGKLTRKIATALVAGDVIPPIEVGGEDVGTWLGRSRFFFEVAERVAVPGVATGLAVTGAGGDVLSVEASVSKGPEGLTLTGQLGDVMRESGEIALSYVRSHAEELGIATNAFEGRRFHLHVPAGAVPKDGPSAGVTMVTALVSLLTGRPLRALVGMTGEVTLQGRVLAIGGVKQKVLAADRAGLTEVALPLRNGPDLEDVPEEVRTRMTFRLVERVEDLLHDVLEGTDTEHAFANQTGPSHLTEVA